MLELLNLAWNLQLFAEAAASGAEAGPAEATGDSGVESVDAAQEEGVTSENATQSEVTDNTETMEESFEDLIKGKFKDEYNNRVSDIVRKRVKKTQDQLQSTTEQLEKVVPMIELLAEKYGIDSDDFEGLSEAVLHDKSMYEEEALERGIDVDTLMTMKSMERDNARLIQQQEEAAEQARVREQSEMLEAQAEEARQIYPNLDLKTEFQNETFAKLIWAGMTVQNAYESVHFKELETLKAKAIADRTAQKVANSIKANAKRPAENGLSAKAGTKVTNDPSSLSEAEIEKIWEQAAAGKAISF